MAVKAFPWLPVGTEIERRSVSRVLSEGDGYQIISANKSSDVLVLVRADTPMCLAIAESVALSKVFEPHEYGDDQMLVSAFDAESVPGRVGDLPLSKSFLSGAELLKLAQALSILGKQRPSASWTDAVYFPHLGECIAVTEDTAEDRHALVIRLLTGGAADTSLVPSDISHINHWVTEEEAASVLSDLGFGLVPTRVSTGMPDGPFQLKGRPTLAAFFQEYVIDYFARREQYAAMKVKPPNGILLYGPPGTGKTSAVRKLASYLGWKVNEVDVGSVGSAYIHQTSVTLRKVFNDAAKQAPTILVMDEIDALVNSRSGGSHDHKVEEVAELLKQVETAAERGILVVATTNRLDAIDPAMLRRGRFDHKIEVALPQLEEIQDALDGLLKDRPVARAINLSKLAEELVGHNMADVAWVVDDSARRAVMSGKDAIDDICLFEALKRLR